MTSPMAPGAAAPADTARSAPNATIGRRKRLVGVDATRGISLLGMVILHSLWEADAAGRPTWSYTIFSGRAAAAFAVLSGVGIALATGRRRVRLDGGRSTVVLLAVRALAIGAIGLVLGHADTVLDAVILPYLAVVFLLAIPLVFLPTWVIAVTGVATAVGMPALVHVLKPHLPEPSLANVTLDYLIDRPVEMVAELSITGFYPALPWMAYVCAGLVIGRLDLTKAKVAVALLAAGSGLAVAAAVGSATLLDRYGGLAQIRAAQPDSGLTASETTELLTFGGNGTAPTSTWWWLATNAPHTATPFDLVGTTGAAAALLGVMLLGGLLVRPVPHRLTALAQVPLAAVGGMTLSFYAAHILFINSDYDTYDAGTGCLVQVVAALFVGFAWQAVVGRGPLEWLVVALATRARRWSMAASRRPPPRLAEDTEVAGATGAAGASGVAGPAGATGIIRTAGIAGTTGIAGSAGIAGATGIAEATEINGSTAMMDSRNTE